MSLTYDLRPDATDTHHMDTKTSLQKRRNERANPSLHPLVGIQSLANLVAQQRQTIARLRNGLRMLAGSDPATRDLAEKIINGNG